MIANDEAALESDRWSETAKALSFVEEENTA